MQYIVVVVLLILTLLLSLSMVSHGTQDGISGSINRGFEELWDLERNETGALSYYEKWLHCCGVNNSEDYGVIHHAVPKSCCIDQKCIDSSTVYKVGCKSQFVEYMDDRLLVFKIVCWLLILGEVSPFFATINSKINPVTLSGCSRLLGLDAVNRAKEPGSTQQCCLDVNHFNPKT